MNIATKGWLSRHRLLALTLTAATAYFLLAPHSESLHYDFSRDSFLIMHTLMESVSVIIAFMCFGIVFHSYSLSKNDRNLVLGVTFLAVGLIDVMHMLSYAGMPSFITPNTVNKATQLWIAGRVVAAVGFLAAAFIGRESGRPLMRPYFLTGLAVLTAAVVFVLVIFYPHWFPAMFITGSGLTPAKIFTEYAVVGVMAVSGAIFYYSYKRTHLEHLPYFTAAMAVLIFSELFFTLYADPYDIYNFMGHVYKTLGYFLIYKMLFITSIQNPHLELSNAKEVLRAYVMGLEDDVKERTLELKSRNEELERLNALKTDFLAMCSHDMKTPIQSSLLLLDLLLDEVDGPLGEGQKEDLMSIKKNQDGLRELITNLLDLARKEHGSLRLEPSSVNLADVLEEIRAAHEGVAGKKLIDFRMSYPDGLGDGCCMLDPPKFKQVVNNLVSNSLKFTPSGGLIEISVTREDGDFLFRIFNTGDPLPEDMLDTIFERYSRIPKYAADSGVGLGLNIARSMVELHGGRIWAESLSGKGNAFYFTIPASRKNDPHPETVDREDHSLTASDNINEHTSTEV